MPTRDQVYYFGAGPAPLPTPVLEEASKVLLDYNETGIGITEISHRSAAANAILAQTQAGLRRLLDIPDADGPEGYEILFLQGGGSGEFSATVYNMVNAWVARQAQLIDDASGAGLPALRERVDHGMKLDYFVTGSWSLKASQEAARLVGSEKVNVVSDARQHHRDGKFGVIPPPSTWRATTDASQCVFTYYCDNETVDGVEFGAPPTGHHLVADMSSNFLSRAVDVRKHAAIFGGAQKNVGTTGITIAIVSKAFLPPHAPAPPDATLLRALGLPVGPIVLDWPTIAKNNSLYNTLPIFDVWIAGQVMERLLAKHPASQAPRIAGQQAESDGKAARLYAALDAHGQTYQVVPDRSVRSRMNICFRVKGGDADAEKAFLAGAEQRHLYGLKGHRSVGGIRISNYNAVPVEAAEKLATYLQEFAQS